MSKLTLTDVTSLEAENTAIATMTANNTAIETAMENTLSRDGTLPNQMSGQIDMNSNRIINLPTPGGDNDPARKIDIDNAMLGHYSGQTINGTANEITASTVTTTTTLSLPSALTFTGKTITGGTFSSCTYSSGTATNLTLVTPTLGTPNSGTLTSCTGLPVSTGISGLGAGIATFLATPSSANLKTAVTDETGSGGALVFATGPTLVTPVLGAATATSVTFSPTTGGIVGTTTNDSVTAGSVGELISSNIASGSAVSLTTSVGANVTSISLTAGDWDVSATAVFLPNAATNITLASTSIGTTSATIDLTTGGAYGTWRFGSGVVVGQTWTVPAGPLRISIASTTTVYLVVNATFTVNTLSAYGIIRARRMR